MMSTDPRVELILQRLSTLKQPALITIDGPCGSGKSTLAAALARATGAPVIHMDDYVVPHSRKTPERLSVPGGNADQERLLAEVIEPWLAGQTASIRPYLCHEDRLGEATSLPYSALLILEGTYCNLPAIARYSALRIFLTVSEQEQQRRLLKRMGPERLQIFNERWIPLENAYFAALGLPDAGCLTLD